ncbi:MAG: radical SAM protein [Planctomycetaceae bacterium]|nr:radical SAM protein [Planctomycetaceae bacterium]
MKYQTKSGNNYLYDCATGHIIRVDDTIYSIVDDWHILTDVEICEKYKKIIDIERIKTALNELQNLQKDNILTDHAPCELSRVERVFYDRREWNLGEFWQRTGMLLILGITERCNLCCSYCCFSGKFAGQRTHSSRSMDWDVAKKAISDFLENDQAGDGTCPITFYGGEPLLEFTLLKDCVCYAETLAKSLGKINRFAVTTNGTLLNDEMVDYLVEHQFLILVSLDGPQKTHDRYRLFPNNQGSFDIISRNLKRFSERYPSYMNRGMNITLAPPLDLDATAEFVNEIFPQYPFTRANLVNTGNEYRFNKDIELSTQYGCYSQSICKKNLRDNGCLEGFRQFKSKDQEQMNKYWNICVESLATLGVVKSWEIVPFAMMLFETQISFYHRRRVTDQVPEWAFFIPCVPGFTRRFLDVEGNYRICERIDHSNTYILGNVWSGLDRDKMERTMSLRRHFGDCGNCHALKVCDICYARIPESDAMESGFDPFFDLQCQRTRETTSLLLQTYTEIMERNKKAFERPPDGNLLQFKKLKYGSPSSRLGNEILEQLKLETGTVDF